MNDLIISIRANQYLQKIEIDEFENQVLELNKNGEGDQAEFYLQKIN